MYIYIFIYMYIYIYMQFKCGNVNWWQWGIGNANNQWMLCQEAKQILVVPVPGSVLRVGLRETFGAPNPGWMQYDDEATWPSWWQLAFHVGKQRHKPPMTRNGLYIPPYTTYIIWYVCGDDWGMVYGIVLARGFFHDLAGWWFLYLKVSKPND